MPIAPAPSFDLEKNLETFRHLLALKPRALLFSHYGPHGKPKAAIEAMMALYPSWDRVVKERLASAGEDGVLRELYDMSCRAAKRFPRDFLERRIRVSIRGLAAYHERLEHVGPRGRGTRTHGSPAAAPRGTGVGPGADWQDVPEDRARPSHGPHVELQRERPRVPSRGPQPGPHRSRHGHGSGTRVRRSSHGRRPRSRRYSR